MKCLQKLRYWLYGVHFILETDANTLVAQLNRAATDLPGALVTRWLAWIRLFDFEVKHVRGRVHSAADGLSRKPRTRSDDIDNKNDMDIDEFIAAELDCAQISWIGKIIRQGLVLGKVGIKARIATDSPRAESLFLFTLEYNSSVEEGTALSINIPLDYLETKYSE